jgi:hypothetical protein
VKQGGTMKIIRRSIYSNDIHSVELPITFEHIRQWQSGKSIQFVFKDLTFAEREFILNGTVDYEQVELAMMEKQLTEAEIH